MSNPIRRIEIIEWTTTFKAFLIRIWCHSYDEYMKLFWDNILLRKVATERCVETYPDLLTNLLQQWRD